MGDLTTLLGGDLMKWLQLFLFGQQLQQDRRREDKAEEEEKRAEEVGSGLAFPINISNVGNSRNEVTNVTVKPALIINPKSMTGLIPLTTRELKPMMVVNAVYRHGFTILCVVVLTSTN